MFRVVWALKVFSGEGLRKNLTKKFENYSPLIIRASGVGRGRVERWAGIGLLSKRMAGWSASCTGLAVGSSTIHITLSAPLTQKTT